MAEFKKQTYDNTYFFSLPGIMEKQHKNITRFILTADRIDKRSKEFRGIVEDVKRYARESLIYSLLLRDDIILGTIEPEMPGTFKVFSAKDLKEKNGNKVFIDVTGLITFNETGGFYTCRDINQFVTYLMESITWLLYENYPLALINNSSATMAGLECFTALFDYVLGYFRFYGYQENRSKIMYLASLYYMIRLLGKDNDSYVRNLAAKNAGIPANNIDAYNLFYDEEKDFFNIDTFITKLASLFKMKGLDTQVFVDKWAWLCGKNAIYSVDLFTAFSNTIIAAYCGSYTVNKKSIEKFAGTSMVKFYNALKKLAIDYLDKKGFSTESEFDASIIRDKSTELLAETMKNRQNAPRNAAFIKSDCKSKTLTQSKIKSLIDYYKNTAQTEKIGSKIVAACKLAIGCMDTKRITENYEIGVLEVIIKESKKYISSDDKNKIQDAITKAINIQSELIGKFRVSNKELSKHIAEQVKELRSCKNSI